MRTLNIGGTDRGGEGWETFDIQAREGVDHVGDARDPGAVVTGPFDLIYASHVLEHIPPYQVVDTLTRWRALTVPGGRVCISVPDVKTLAKILSTESPSVEVQRAIMDILYGGQTDAYDIHYAGYTWDILEYLLWKAGWVKRQRVEDFGLVTDTSTLYISHRRLSLNVEAYNGS